MLLLPDFLQGAKQPLKAASCGMAWQLCVMLLIDKAIHQAQFKKKAMAMACLMEIPSFP